MVNGHNTELYESLASYARRMSNIRSLSSPGLDETATEDAYSSILRGNFRNIGRLAARNRKLIAELIEPILDSEEPLDEEVVRAIELFNEELLNAEEGENIDLPIASLLTDRLMGDADRKDDIDYRIRMLDREIESNYLLANMTKRVSSSPDIANSYRRKGLDALTELLRYLDKDKFLTLSEESRETVVVNSRYGAALLEGADEKLARAYFFMLIRAIETADDPFYHEAMPNFDWRYHYFRIYDYMAMSDSKFLEKEMTEKAALYADRCMEIWKSDPGYYKDLSDYREIEGRALKLHYLAGHISNSEYLERIYALFRSRDTDDYSSIGIDMNVWYPTDYLESMEDECLTERSVERAEEICRSILAYTFRMPKLGLLSAMLDPYAHMLSVFRELPGNISFEEMGMRSLAALHPPTYIHSKMVAGITRCLTRHLLRLEPGLFQEVFRYLHADPADGTDRILDYAYHAALCHDFGKIMIIDTIFVYGRKLLDMEFNLVKQHPELGCTLLKAHHSTKAYADVAAGHHLWYDGSRGYPMSFDPFASPVKTIIDIVAIADCMDAATDSVGRSYNKGKTLSEYEEEVVSSAGTRYAPWGPMLLQNEEVRCDLEYLLTEGRLKQYRETYLLLRDVIENQD